MAMTESFFFFLFKYCPLLKVGSMHLCNIVYLLNLMKSLCDLVYALGKTTIGGFVVLFILPVDRH